MYLGHSGEMGKLKKGLENSGLNTILMGGGERRDLGLSGESN